MCKVIFPSTPSFCKHTKRVLRPSTFFSATCPHTISFNCPAHYAGAFRYRQCPTGQLPNRDTGLCGLPPQNKSNGGSSSCGIDIGNPVNAATGNKWQHEVDLVGGASGLAFGRYYNASTPANDTHMGSGWLHTYKGTVTAHPSGTSVLVRRPDGKEYLFYKQTTGAWGSDADVLDRLEEITGSADHPTGWQYTTAGDSVETYDADGNLTRLTDRAGLTLTLSYSCTDPGTACPLPTPKAIARIAGLLIKVTDHYGKSINLTYDYGLHIATMTDPVGHTTRYGYDANNNLRTVTYPDNTPDDQTDNPQKTYVYGNSPGELANTAGIPQTNALTGIIGEDGVRYATYRYDAQGRAVSSEHTGGANYTLSYAPDGNSTQVTDPLGTVRTLNFTTILGIPKPTGTNQPGGSGCAAAASNTGYDANGNVVSRTNFNGHKTCYAYDLARNLETARIEGLPGAADCAVSLAATELAAPARKISTRWHDTYRLPRHKAAPGLLTHYTYDPVGNLLARSEQTTTDPTGAAGLAATAQGKPRTWTYTYNSLGQMLTTDGPRNDVSDLTRYTYYPADDTAMGNRGNLATVTNALNQTTTINRYDGNGRPTQVTAANGTTTDISYTPRGWPETLAITAGDSIETTRYGYAPIGLLTTVTRPDASTLTYGYDAAHRLTSISDNAGNRHVYHIDGLGNIRQDTVYGADGQTVHGQSRDYDALGRLAASVGTDGQTHNYRYDAQGNLTSYTSPLQHRHDYRYDSLARLTDSLDPANGSIHIRYDGADNPTAVTDPNGHTTGYEYDGYGDRREETSPDRGTLNYRYDEAGNLITVTDALGTTHTSGYDALGRPVRQTHSPAVGIARTTSWHYDQTANGLGQLGQIDDASGNTSYSYDPQGRLLSKTQTSRHGNSRHRHTLNWAYNLYGQLDSLNYPSGLTLRYSHDAQGRIDGITANGQPLLSAIRYTPDGQPQAWIWGNGHPYRRDHGPDGRLTGHPLGESQRRLNNDADSHVSAYTQNKTPTRDRSFSYDELGRLRSEHSATGQKSQQYDANGNRTRQQNGGTITDHRIAATSNQLAASKTKGSPPHNYRHDAGGNLVQDGDSTYRYDAEGQLAQAKTATGTTRYQYNGLGERVIKAGGQQPNSPHRYLYDQLGHLLGEYDNTGTPRQETVWLDDLPVAVILPDGKTNTQAPNPRPVPRFRHYHIHADHLNTPRAILDTANRTVWRWDNSDAFGNGSPQEDPDHDGKRFTYNLRFPGQYFDAETGLHYNMTRYYSPRLGRYIQSDRIGLAGGLNTYGYVGGDPVDWVDPLGLFALPLVIPIGQTIVDAITIVLGGAMMVDSFQSKGINWDEMQKDVDNVNYHRTCDRPPPPRLSLCELAKWEYRQAKSCYDKRKEWEDRWGNASTKEKHVGQLVQVKQRMANAASRIAAFCEEGCE
ncbi:MAG: DUF6531 domain-containing protein [Methylococcales bacterium]|nr:DUF6531 domain-containing protein [Methylococcales bacterium]